MRSVGSIDLVDCVVVGAGSRLALETAVEIRKLGPINPVLVGQKYEIDRSASELGIAVSDFEICDTPDDEAAAGNQYEAVLDTPGGTPSVLDADFGCDTFSNVAAPCCRNPAPAL